MMKGIEIARSTGWECLQGGVVAVSLSSGNVAVFQGLEADLWNLICEGNSPANIIKHILLHYEVPESRLTIDLEQFVSNLRQLGFLKETSE